MYKRLREIKGYHYFGARYYDSEVSVWLSVDPLANRYPMMSPYMYAAGNPIMFIDPDGMSFTDFGVKSNGEVVQIGPPNKEPDRLYAINDDGTKKSEDHVTINDKNLLPSLTKVDPSKKEGDYWAGKVRKYKYNPKTKKETYKDEYKEYLQLYYAKTKSGSDARKIFKFAAKNSVVEWGLNKNKQGVWIVGTLRQVSQAPSSTGVPGFEFKNILFSAHSHGGKDPNVDFIPSENDISRAKKLKVTNPSSQSWLFTPQNPKRIWIDLNEY